MNTTTKQVQPGMVIQVNESANADWTGCLMIVDEVKSFGVQAYIKIPMEGTAYLRLKWDQFEIIGQAVFVHEQES